MMSFVRAASVVMALCFAASITQAADAPPPPPSPVLAQRLADLLDPVDLVVAMDRRFAAQNLERLPPTHPIAAIRQKNPKLFAVIAAAWQDAVEDLIRERYPDKRARVVSLFQASLSQDDLQALIDYYESPVGRKVVATGFAKMNAPVTAAPTTMTHDEFEAAAAAARRAMVEQLSPEEAAAVVKFARSPAVARFEPVNLKRLAMSVDWGNSLSPELQRVVNARIQKAMRDYVSAHPREPH
jgi:hypothetical protein